MAARAAATAANGARLNNNNVLQVTNMATNMIEKGREYVQTVMEYHGGTILLTIIAWCSASIYLANHSNILIDGIDSTGMHYWDNENRPASAEKEGTTFVLAVLFMSFAILTSGFWFLETMIYRYRTTMTHDRGLWVSLVPVLVIAIIASVRNARPNINMDRAGETGWGGNLYIAAVFWMYILVVVATGAVRYTGLYETGYLRAGMVVITGLAMWGTVEGLKHSRETVTET